MAWSNVGADSASARLLKAAQAAALAEDLPKESGRTLVALTRSVRLYLEAWDQGLALAKLDQVDEMLATCEDAAIRDAFQRHTSEVRRALNFKPKSKEE